MARVILGINSAGFKHPPEERMSCHYHPTSPIDGTCPRCNNEYCGACASRSRLNGFEKLCLDCAAAIALRRLRTAMNAALFGLLLAMWICTVSCQSAGLVPITGFAGGYVSWATFWGWHTDSVDWTALAQRCDNLLRRKWSGTVLLLCTRLACAVGIGIFREGIEQPCLVARTLRRWKIISSHSTPSD